MFELRVWPAILLPLWILACSDDSAPPASQASGGSSNGGGGSIGGSAGGATASGGDSGGRADTGGATHADGGASGGSGGRAAGGASTGGRIANGGEDSGAGGAGGTGADSDAGLEPDAGGIPSGVCKGRDAKGGVPPDVFPGEACTGVPPGTVLTRVPEQATTGNGWHVENGTFYVTEKGAHIDALDIGMEVKVFADDVTISRSRVRYAGYYNVFPGDPPKYYSGFTLIDSELDGLGNAAAQTIAIVAVPNAHYVRINVHGMASSGPRLTDGDVVEDSYVHDFACMVPDHSAGMSANGPGKHIVVRHNNIDIDTDCGTAAWELAKDFGTFDDVLTERNLFNGGSYCAYAAIVVPGGQYGQATNIRFVNNVFGREHHAGCGVNGAIAQWGSAGGSVWSGNVWGDGAAATNAHHTGDPVNP